MSQGLTFASALNQGTGLFGELNRLALARDEVARRAEQDAAQQALRQQIFAAQQQAAAEQLARQQAEQQAGASLLAQLGVEIPQANFVGPVTPQYPTPNVDLSALSPTFQRQLAEPAMKAQQQTAAQQLAQQRSESERMRLIDEVTRLDAEIGRRGEKDPIRRRLEVKRNAAEAALLNLDFGTPQGTAMTALGGGQSGPSPGSLRQAQLDYADVQKARADLRGVIRGGLVSEDEMLDELSPIIALADAKMRNAVLNAHGFQPESFVGPELGALGPKPTADQLRKAMDRAVMRFEAVFNTGRDPGQPSPTSMMDSPEGQSAALDRAAGVTGQLSSSEAVLRAKAALQQSGRWPVSPEELAAVAKQLMTQGAQ